MALGYGRALQIEHQSHKRSADKVDFSWGRGKPLSMLVFRMNKRLLSPKQDRQLGVEMGGR